MSTLKSYANTKIDMFKTQSELEGLLAKHGIRASSWTHFSEVGNEPGTVRFDFEWQRPDRPALGFRVEVSYKGKLGPQGGQQGTTREQAGRALYWHVKNLFDAVDFGIVDLEQAFMPYLLLASGSTAYETSGAFFKSLVQADMASLLTEGRKHD